MLSNASPRLVRDAGARRGPWARIDVVEVALARRRRRRLTPTRSARCRFARLDPEARDRGVPARRLAELPQPPGAAPGPRQRVHGDWRLDEATRRSSRRCRRAGLGGGALRARQSCGCVATTPRARPPHSPRPPADADVRRRARAIWARRWASWNGPRKRSRRWSRRCGSIRSATRSSTTSAPASATSGGCDEAEAAFRRVIALRRTFVFGHYNLGHALFLQGRFADARDAYEAGLTARSARRRRGSACGWRWRWPALTTSRARDERTRGRRSTRRRRRGSR